MEYAEYAVACVVNSRVFQGSLDIKQKENYASDPRKILADFYSPGGGLGPRGVSTVLGNLQTSWFAVYRPTSRDALAKHLCLAFRAHVEFVVLCW